MEGPSIAILEEELLPFLGNRVLSVRGNSKQPIEELKGQVFSGIDTWAKVVYLIFGKSLVVKIHFLLFGSYRINDPKITSSPRLEIRFNTGTLYFYSCSVQFVDFSHLEGLPRKVDLLAPEWDEGHILGLLERKKTTYLCDLLLDQSIFGGSGNIVKNEVLFNLRRHPLTKLGDIDPKDWPLLVHAVKEYCFNFYEWKKIYQLRKHWQVYRKSYCPVCESKLIRQNLGKYSRRTFYCPKCQRLKLARRLEVYDVLPVSTGETPEERLDH